MELTEDAWRALARSSPWRWRGLHFTRLDDEGSVEAWVRRPGQLFVRAENGRETYRSEPNKAGAVVLTAVAPMGSGADPSEPASLPLEAEPRFRPDGLLQSQRSSWDVDDDLIYDNYLWVAMLDPAELSEHTAVDNLRVETVAGREAWRATVRAAEGYDPRCPCCPLLWSEQSHRIDAESCGMPFDPSLDFPDAYDVALDVETAIVVELHPLGGPRDTWFSVTIHGVDEPMDEVFTGKRPRRGR